MDQTTITTAPKSPRGLLAERYDPKPAGAPPDAGVVSTLEEMAAFGSAPSWYSGTSQEVADDDPLREAAIVWRRTLEVTREASASAAKVEGDPRLSLVGKAEARERVARAALTQLNALRKPLQNVVNRRDRLAKELDAALVGHDAELVGELRRDLVRHAADPLRLAEVHMTAAARGLGSK